MVGRRLVALFALLAAFLLAGNAQAATYYVRTTGNDTTGDGSDGAPWATVQKAITTVSLDGGHTILIGAGTYDGSGSGNSHYFARTFVSTVTLSPEAGAAVVLQGGAGAASVVAFGTNAQNVTIDGLGTGGASITIQPGGTEASVVKAANNSSNIADITLKNLAIASAVNAGFGVNLQNTSITNFTLENVTIAMTGTGDTIGVTMYGSATGMVTNVVLTSCTVSAALEAVQIHNLGRLDGLTITGGTYTASGTTGCAIGGMTALGGDVEDITLTNVTTAGGGHGYYLSSVTNTITRLTATNCTMLADSADRVGLFADGHTTVIRITGGTYSGDTTDGNGAIEIRSAGNSDVIIDGVTATCTDNGLPEGSGGTSGHAIGLAGVDDVEVTNSTILSTNDGRGISLGDGASNVWIHDNTLTSYAHCFRIAHDAATAYDVDTVLIEDNDCRGGYAAAIIGAGAHNVTIRNNYLSAIDYGIRIRGDATNVNNAITGNWIVTKGGTTDAAPIAAIAFLGGDNNTVTGNTIISAWPVAFLADTWETLLASGNTVTGNRVTQIGGALYNWPTADDDGTNVFDYQRISLQHSATFGEVTGTSGITTLSGLRSAWAGGSGDDAHSRMDHGGISMGMGF